MPGTVAEAPTVPMCFANNFWGKEDAGVHPLLERMHNAKTTCDELKTFYNARASIEEEYARKLMTLCRKPLGSSEAGTLRTSMDIMRGEVESMGKAHQTISAQMKSELEEPLAAFAGGMKERRKIVQTGIEKLYKVKLQQTQAVNKTRDRYEQDCLKIKGYLAQGHMVMGQEERKNKAKMEKTQIQLASTSNEYEAAVKALEETTGRWNRDWKAACDKFQDLEEERLDFTKSSLWTFANVASTVCVSDDASCEKIRLSLENCEVEKDIISFIHEKGTGQEIPDPPKYTNFCRGDPTDSASEVSEDENYSVAQFQRTINPAFRSSSPQPSVFESHNDPKSELAMRMGHQEQQTPSSREATLTPQKPTQPPPVIDYHRQAQAQAQVQSQLQHAEMRDLAAVPHNEYPTDGMTMFCRTAPPSERSAAASPIRSSSRDSHSEYSNPTSFSSQEPPNKQQSPSKLDTVNAPPVENGAKQVQKKRSGFFGNGPFRRKSKSEKDGRDRGIIPAFIAPTTESTWNHSSVRDLESANPSPTRSYGYPKQTRKPRDSSQGPEPVDPQASFQLNVGPNVFDVASPDSSRNKTTSSSANSPSKELDPIAQALAELKGINKQSSIRMSADRYHGITTPAPPGTPSASATSKPFENRPATQHDTPPPSYHDQQPVKRLDLPQPAFTSKQMNETTRKYVTQAKDMYGSSRSANKSSAFETPRATSPSPIRGVSPGLTQESVQPSSKGTYSRSSSPFTNARVGQSKQIDRHSPMKEIVSSGSAREDHSHRESGINPYGTSSQSRFPQQRRPNSSAGTMALQLSNSGQIVNHNERGGGVSRPMSYIGGEHAQNGDVVRMDGNIGRVRSKSIANERQYTSDGRPILQFAKALYLYRAAIPEELSFAKGDILAILRFQDDGWWEAEVTGKRGRPGLVPSNYLQAC